PARLEAVRGEMHAAAAGGAFDALCVTRVYKELGLEFGAFRCPPERRAVALYAEDRLGFDAAAEAILDAQGGTAADERVEPSAPEGALVIAIARPTLENLALAYAAGADVRWHLAHEGRPAGRVVLPTYPFERRPHWVERPPELAKEGPGLVY